MILFFGKCIVLIIDVSILKVFFFICFVISCVFMCFGKLLKCLCVCVVVVNLINLLFCFNVCIILN